jgi:hypothetical protein
MDIIELFIDEEDEVSGIEAVSIVESPAIESDFIALKKQEFKFAEVNKEKRILMGAALIPNKPIYRRNEENEYYIYFSKDTVRKASELFFIRGNQNNSTLEHNVPLTGLTAVESWIVEDEKDKTRFYGLDVPIGTWMLSMKVQNDDVWNDYVKSGKVKGFSIEGYFADKLERPNEPKKDMSKEEIAEAKIEELRQLFSNQKVDLGLIDEVKKVSSTIESDWKKALRIAEDGSKNLVFKLNSKIKPLRSQVLSLKDGIEKAEKMLKDLGIGKNSDIAQAKRELKIANGQIAELDRIIKNLYNYINY